MKNDSSHPPSRLFLGSSSMMRASLLTFLIAALLAAGCATLRRGAADVVMPVDQEIELGRKLSAEVEEELDILANPAVQRYITSLGNRAVAAAGGERHRDMSFTFKVVDDPDTINAFALPGGFIYIYSGLLLAAETEAEVMSVLSHEVAHVTKRHIAERLATNYGLQVLAAVALGEDSSTLQQMVASIAGTGYLLRFSREQEVDADLTGLRYTIGAGYSPKGFVDFFGRLAGDRSAGSRKALTWISTHPMPEDRASYVEEAIAEHAPVPTREGRSDHQRMLASLGTKSGDTPPKTREPTSTDQPTTAPPPSGTSDRPTGGRGRTTR